MIRASRSNAGSRPGAAARWRGQRPDARAWRRGRRSPRADGRTSSSSGGVYGIGRSSGRLTRRGALAQRIPPIVSSRDDRGAPAAGVDLLLDDDEPAGLLDRRAHRRQVERADPAQVDDLGVDPVGGQLLGSGKRPLHHQQRRHDRHVAARAQDRGLAELRDLAAPDRAPSGRTGPCARGTGPGCRRGSPPAAGSYAEPGRDAVTTRRPGQVHEPALAGRGVLGPEAAGRAAR